MNRDLKLCLLFAVYHIALCEQSIGNVTLTTCKEVKNKGACRLTCKTPDLNGDIVFESPNHQTGKLSCKIHVSGEPDCTTESNGYSLHQDKEASLTHLDIANVKQMIDDKNWNCRYKTLVSNVETIKIIIASDIEGKIITTPSTGSFTELEKEVPSDATDHSSAESFQIVYIIAPIAAGIVLLSITVLIIKYRNEIIESLCERQYHKAEPDDPLEQGIVNKNKV